MMSHDEMIAVIQAHKRGETIESRKLYRTSGIWYPAVPIWDFNEFEYRVKPREPGEFWITADKRCFSDAKSAAMHSAVLHRCVTPIIHVREVIE